MNDYKEILTAIRELDSKFDTLREEVILNRENNDFVTEMKKVTTIDQYRERIKKFDSLIALKNRVVGVMIAAQFLFGLAMWYLGKTLF